MRISPISKHIVYITMGDPAGIGPEIIMRSLASPEIKGLASYVVIGDIGVLSDVAGGLEYKEVNVESARNYDFPEDIVSIVDPGGDLPGHSFGKPVKEGAAKALASIDLAVDLMKYSPEGSVSALVTAPVSKEMVASVKEGFIGHTEYLQEAFSAEMVTMVMVGEKLKVVPVTRHIPLKDVAGALNKDLIAGTIRQVLKNRYVISGKKEPSVSVCALNPHCGEGGKIGTEEMDVISPAVEEVGKEYPDIEGPVSADVVFYKALKGGVDIVISMYHDQCLSPFKMIDFDRGVNMTLGLSYVRTSPDHGTAFDIAGKGVANPESMQEAIKLALRAVGA